LEAHASDSAVVNQAGRDLHVHHGPGVRRTTAGRAGECPYPGLAAFESSEARWFFGRDAETAELLERLDRRVSAGGIQFVVAPSGAGKSSLLRAGLLASLADDALRGSAGWTVRLRTPGTDPLAVLDELRDDPGEVLVLDQFEELFATAPSVARQVVDRLAELAGSGTRVVLGLRADFYPNCTDHPVLRDALRDRPVLLGPMDDDELRAAIRFPAQDVGLEVEAGLIELVLADLDGDGTLQAGRLPLLAHALRACWRHRHGHTLTLDGYRATGGIERAIATTAEDTYAALDPPGQAAARTLFTRLVRIGADTPDTRRRLSPGPLSAELGAAGASVLEAFTRQRLLTRGQDSVEITHEALLRAWPRLAEWINRDRAGALLRQQLHEDAEQWQRSGCDPALLYRGSRLETAHDWAEVHRDTLGPTGAAFLASAHDAHQRSVRTRRAAVAALTTLAVVASAAAGVSLVLGARYRAERDSALATQLSSQAEVVRAGDPSLAAQLDLAAYRRHPTPRTALALAVDSGRPLATPLPGHWDDVAYRPDGRVLASVSASGPRSTLQLWNGEPLRPLGDPVDVGPGAVDPGGSTPVVALRFSPDSKTLIAVIHGQGAQLWNVSDPARPARLGAPVTEGFSQASSLTFSDDARRMVTVGANATQLWDTGDPARPVQLSTLRTAPTALPFQACFDNAGRTAVISTTGGIERWDLSDPSRPVGRTALPSDGIALCRPGGGMLAVSGRDDVFQLWDTHDPALPVAVAASPLPGEPRTWSLDGHRLASNVGAGQVHLWELGPDGPVESGSLNADTGLLSARFDPTGHNLVSIGDRDRRWTLPDAPHTPARVDGLDAAGSTVATIGPDGVRLLDLHTLARTRPTGEPLPGTASAQSATLRSDAALLLVTSSKVAALWNVHAPSRPILVGPAPDAVADSRAQAWADRTLLTCETDDVRTWDTTSPGRFTALASVPVPGGCAALAAAGRRVAVAGATGVQLFDLYDQRHLAPVGPPLPPGDLTPVTGRALAMSQDGRYLTALGDAGLQLWDVSDPAHPGAVGEPIDATDAAFAAQRLITSDSTTDVQVWDLDPERAADHICAATPGVLTEANWATYAGTDIDYEPTCP
jgi:WD40 repeat protein